MSRNRITGGSGFWMIFACIVAFVIYPKAFMVVIILTTLAIIILVANFYSNLPVCPSCKNKVKLVFLHQRVDGGPDRRYNYNPLVCPYCRINPHTFANPVKNYDTPETNLKISNNPSLVCENQSSNPAPSTPQELEAARVAKLQARHLEARRRMDILREKWNKKSDR